ncbi:MAG: zinc-binding dehydrogenase [Clostridia bacterium]|nr:zinc-binding dehydrogenase [Clostridia bacterium]
MSEKMKAVFTTEPGKSEVREVPMPKMKDNCIMIKQKYVGVCMSEHYDWANVGGRFGHEPMGVVCEVGKNVRGFEVGDRVSGLWGSGLPGAGGMVQYAVVNPKENTVIKLADNVKDEDAVLEPLACLFSAVSKANIDMPNTKVCVVGCGYMGCGAISILKLRGAYVVAVDPKEACRKNALKYGADEVYDVDEALEKYGMASIGKGVAGINSFEKQGFKVVMEWGETSESLNVAIELTRMLGQLCIGAYHTGPSRTINMQLANVKAIDMLSTHPRDMDRTAIGAKTAADMLASGTWNFRDIPTMIYPINAFDKAHRELESKYGHHMKALINMEMEDGEPYLINGEG